MAAREGDCPRDAAGRLWDDTVAMMSDGVRDGRIITTPPRYWDGQGRRLQRLPPEDAALRLPARRACRAGTAGRRWP